MGATGGAGTGNWNAGECGGMLMRERKEIEEEVTEANAEHSGAATVALLQLEILLEYPRLA